jgi:hybrid cluster-associated redox disulfide protein
MTRVAGQLFDADTTVDEIMNRCPETIRVFLDYRMRCVGCPIGCFHTIADAAREHGADEARFTDDLLKAAAKRA